MYLSETGDQSLGWRGLKPEDKVTMTICMSDACVRICAEGIRAQFPNITDEELLEKLRERLDHNRKQRLRYCRREV